MPKANLQQDDDEGIVRCICNNKAKHTKYIRCDACLVWQHTQCMGVNENEEPAIYYCDDCSPGCHLVDSITASRVFTLIVEEPKRTSGRKSAKEKRSIDSDPSPKPATKTKVAPSNKPPQLDPIIEDVQSKFVTSRGRKTNRVPYNQLGVSSEQEKEKEPEVPEKVTIIKEVVKLRKPRGTKTKIEEKSVIKKIPSNGNATNHRRRNYKASLSNGYTAFNDTHGPSSSPPLVILSPMKMYALTPVADNPLDMPSSPIDSPPFPPANQELPPLLARPSSPPPKPRAIHGRVSIKEAAKRVRNMQRFIEDFQGQLESHPNPSSSFPESTILARQLLERIAEFEEKFT